MKRTSIENREVKKKKNAPKTNKLTIVFVLLVVACLISIVIILYYVNDITSLKFKEDVYQYSIDSRIDYPIGAKVENKDMNSIIKANDKNSIVDSSPFYSKNENRIYLAKSYTWYSINDGGLWRIPEFSSLLEQKNNAYICTINNKEYDIYDGFLVSGMNNYLFLDNGTITINYDTYNVSKMSFYSYDYEIIRIYDYENDKYIEIDEKVDSIEYKSVKGYSLDLLKGLYTNLSGERLLIVSSPDLLDSVEKRDK